MATVLIANDSRHARTTLRTALEASGHRVIDVIHAADVFRAIQAEPADAIVLNLSLPGMSAIEIVRTLRCDGWSLPVIVTCIDLPAPERRELDSLGAQHIEMLTFNAVHIASSLSLLLHHSTHTSAA